MDILKYFFEEPLSLEALSPDLDPDARRRDAPSRSLEDLFEAPRYFRGYLAGTNLADGRVGLTALAHPEAFVEPLLDWLGGLRWTRGTSGGAVERLDEAAARAVLAHPVGTAALACAAGPLPEADVAAAAGGARRYAVPALRRLLQAARVVFFPEPAHHGHDWSFFSARPMRAALVEALRRHPAAGTRRFVLPYRQARSEEKFYFESWQLNQPLPDHIEEV